MSTVNYYFNYFFYIKLFLEHLVINQIQVCFKELYLSYSNKIYTYLKCVIFYQIILILFYTSPIYYYYYHKFEMSINN